MNTATRIPDSKLDSPTPEQIRLARDRAALTQTAAAELIHSELRRWQTWEAGTARMHPGLFELFTIKANILIAITAQPTKKAT